MCNPYDNNPFKTDNTRDSRSEYDANRRLVESMESSEIFAHKKWRETLSTGDSWLNGYALGVANALSHARLDILTDSTSLTDAMPNIIGAIENAR